MKYFQFFNKEQEDRSHLMTETFGSILGLDLYTSVVNPLPEKMTRVRGNKKLEGALQIISKNNSCEVVFKFCYTSHKAFVS